MKKLMLIDASDPAETRVVVTRDDRVEEFDREIGSHAQIKGNIYLAKVTRVEPSLQAAFVDYGGNRHGFLPFSEIHPDYYRIPIADREALLAEEAAIKAATEDEDEEEESASESTSAESKPAEAKPKQSRSRSRRSSKPKPETEDKPEAALPVASVPSETVGDAAPESQAAVTNASDADAPEIAATAESEAPSVESGAQEAGEPAAPAAGAPEVEAPEAVAEAPEEPIPDAATEGGDDLVREAPGPDEASEHSEAPAEPEEQPDAADKRSGGDRSQPMTAKSGDQISATPEEAAAAPHPESAAQAVASDAATGDVLRTETEDAPAEEAADLEATGAEDGDTTASDAMGAHSEAKVDEATSAPVDETPVDAGQVDEAPVDAGQVETEQAETTQAGEAEASEESDSGSGRRSRSRRSGRRSGRSRQSRSEEKSEPQEVEAAEESKGRDVVEQVEQETEVDTLDGDDIEDAARRRAKLLRRYKIQEVIKRGQIMLVQASKEERGNKGAALTTYLSLPGRYCVLMPNTARGGGISRKIASSTDRKRLKQVLSDMEIPDGMAVIVRTAGSERSKTEIRRDYDYLIRLWGEIREGTLQAQAPALIYEEGNIIKRAIRDLYTSDMQAILVEGEDGYKAAKAFMRNLMPSHARKVQIYKEEGLPLLQEHRVETQLASMFQPDVQLRSGGYLVINVTEALVAIDVNSGKATRERHIEETALKTNLEAATEVARQLRLRDLAGLIVIDFIDMEENRHNREVERRLKEAMKADRARIQLGRISPFGLLELSRQRLRPSLVETSMVTCAHCGGIGRLYSPETAAMALLRAVAEEGGRRVGGEVVVTVPTAVALYLLNQKREQMLREEERFEFELRVEIDDSLSGLQHRIERIGGSRRPPTARTEVQDAEPKQDTRGGGRQDTRGRSRDAEPEAEEQTEAPQQSEQAAGGPEDEQEDSKRRRRRGKRGGRRRSRRGEDGGDANGQAPEVQAQESQSGESQAPGTQAPDTQAPDVQASESRTQEPDSLSPDETGAHDEALQTRRIEITVAQPEALSAVSAAPEETQDQQESPAEGGVDAQSEPEGNGEDRDARDGVSEDRQTAEDTASPPSDTQSVTQDDEAKPESTPTFDVVTAPDPETPKRRGWWNRLVR
ncbi:MAG: hypothetical protein Kilf2KO_38510 [Rhodospirillales bacterium]